MKDIGLLFEYLKQPRRIVLLTHVRPDGDAVGSSLGLKHYLDKKGHTVDVIVPDDFPDFLNWMPGSDKCFNHQKNPKTCFAVLTRAECIFFLDFNAIKRIEALGDDVLKLNRPYVSVMIDHHREPDHFADYELWNEQASSTAELVFNFIGLAGHAHEMDANIAACIYAGLVSDTGVFQFSNTTARVHEIAAQLMATGINVELIHNALLNQYGENRMRFVGYMLAEKMVVLPEFRAAYMSVTMQEAERFRLNNGDKEGVVNLPLAMRDVDMAVLFTEDRDKIKISFRSKGTVNVEYLARNFFNGGGHRNAAGGSSRISLAETEQHFVSLLPEFIKLEL